MRLYARCFTLFLASWVGWYAFLVFLGAAGGLTVNEDLLRIIRNFTVWVMIRDILFFFVSQLFVLMLLSWLCFLAARGLQHIFDVSDRYASISTVFCLLVLLHVLNSLFFPVSRFAFFVAPTWAYPLLCVIAVVLGALCVIGCLRKVALLACFFSLSLFVVFYDKGGVVASNNQTAAISYQNKPNIIVIGIDALRPKELAYFERQHSVMPFLDGMLNYAEVFKQAYTPAARTHAAWVSILSGRYPYHNGARFNLTEDRLIDKQNLITHTLRSHGYRTVWGLDERRFNNIDESYGFDISVGPKVGAADFLITRLSDNPLVNLLSNTQVGKELFPYIYQNRANFVTYIPYRFNDELVGAMKGTQPVFLSAHLTLPHYPFINHLMVPVLPDKEINVHYRNYVSMLELVDRQLSDLFDKLSEAGFLDQAIVYFISDHGEGFPDVDEGLGKGNPYSEFKVNSYGHGTNVMTLSQYHVLLARVQFLGGEIVSSAREVDRLVSLIDISPDILDKLNLKSEYPLDGIALDKVDKNRYVVIESSYSNDAVSASRISQLEVLQQSAEAYYVAEDGRLLLREDMSDGFNRAKQRALIGSDGVMVAVFPDEKDNVFVIDLENKSWWPSHPYVPSHLSVWEKHLRSLCDFYMEDASFERKDLCALAHVE